MSKVWLAMSPDERRVKSKVYRDRYKAKHPERVLEQERRYKEKYKERLRRQAVVLEREKRRRNKLAAVEFLGSQCVDCGGRFHPDVFDFHHLKPHEKEKNIAAMMSRSFERIKLELMKCELVCANCHRLRHIRENGGCR